MNWQPMAVNSIIAGITKEYKINWILYTKAFP